MGVGTPANILEGLSVVWISLTVYIQPKRKSWTCLYKPWKDESVQCKI